MLCDSFGVVVPFVCVSAVSPSMFTGISTEKCSRWKTPMLCLFFHSLNSLKSDNSSALASDELRKSRVSRTWANSFSVFLLRSHHDEESMLNDVLERQAERAGSPCGVVRQMLIHNSIAMY